MDFDIALGIKRKSSSASQIKSSKRKRVDPCINILDLSDCTLLHILQFIDATGLYQLGETCTRFKQLVQDESLWVHVDARSRPNNNEKTQFCWENITKRTRAILMAGDQRSDFVLSLDILISSNTLNNLTILALEHQCVKYCLLKEFPPSLEELSFRHSFIPRHSEFFRFAQEGMGNLKTLILDHCQWLEADSLISFSRFPKLEILSLYMCKKLGDDDISEVSLAGNLGFKALKVIDLRFTGLGENFLRTFHKSKTLQCIYFQCFPSTYRLERTQRKLDILNGSSPLENSYMSDDDSNNDFSKRSFMKRFRAEKLITSDSKNINDKSLLVFDCLKPAERKMRPKSFLYKYPYGECKCGNYDKILGSYSVANPLSSRDDNWICVVEGSQSTDDESDDWDIDRLHQRLQQEQKKVRMCAYQRDVFFMQPDRPKICRKINFDCCTSPGWCQMQSHPNNCYHRWLYVREPRNDFEISMLEHTDKHFKIRAIHSICGTKDKKCKCGEMCNDESLSVIVVSRNEDGRVIHYRPSWNPPARSYSIRESTNAEITYLISKLATFFKGFEQSSMSDVLKTFDKCSKFGEHVVALNIPKLLDDKEFIQSLYESLSDLARLLSENCMRILTYHYTCFGDLLVQLSRLKDDVEAQKKLLNLFFKNMLYSINGDEFIEPPVEEQTQSSSTDENWNLPGPSGMGQQRSSNAASDHSGSNDSNSRDSKRAKEFVNSPYNIQEVFNRSLLAIQPNLNIFFETNPSPRTLVSRVIVPPFDRLETAEVVIQRLNRHIFTNIKELSLRGYAVTDSTLITLKELELDLLDVTGTQVTDNGLRSFLASNPQCRLIHEQACVCRPTLHF